MLALPNRGLGVWKVWKSCVMQEILPFSFQEVLYCRDMLVNYLSSANEDVI